MICDFEDVNEFLKRKRIESDVVRLPGMNSVYEVKLAYLKKAESNRLRDFTFEYDQRKSYFMFVTIERNLNFCKQTERVVNNNSNPYNYNQNYNYQRKQLNFSFDYSKYFIALNIAKRETLDSEFEIVLQIHLNRENTAVSQCNKDSIIYMMQNKNIKTTNPSTIRYEDFQSILEHYYILAVESKKSLGDTSLKDDGIMSVLYIIVKEMNTLVDIFTLVKYSLFFIKESLYNYISKYIYDMIYEFTHLPNRILLKFLGNLGVILTKGENQKMIYPLKQKIKAFSSLYYYNKVHHFYKNITNIKKGNSLSTVPLHKFIQMNSKYDMYFAEKDFRIKQTVINKNKSFFFLKNSCIIDPKNDKITKEHKIDLNQTLTDFFKTVNEVLNDYVIHHHHNPDLEKFFMESLSKFIVQYTSYKGFFNIDIIMNEDSMVELNCCKNKRARKFFNSCAYNCIARCMNCFNKIFEFNEGFFHKHFSVLDYAYNFNERNVIHTFPAIYDSSKKNKVRVFDIPFSEKWSSKVGMLIFFIYKEYHGLTLLNLNERDISIDGKENSDSVFYSKFGECVDTLAHEFFELYEPVLPDYLLFCYKISKFPLDQYNCVDNLCQHFTNSCIQTLIKPNVFFFSPYTIVYDLNKLNINGLLTQPILNAVLEPYLILVDDNLKSYLDSKENKEQFLAKKKMNLHTYLLNLKAINSQKVQYCLILGESRDSIQRNSILEMIAKNDYNECTEVNCQTFSQEMEKCDYDFYFLLNLSSYFVYKLGIEIKEQMIHYATLKRYIDSHESSLAISFNEIDQTFLLGQGKSMSFCKKLTKDVKKELMQNMKHVNKIHALAENMTYIFMQYVKSVIDIVKDVKKKDNNNNNNNSYIKIGHFLVNYNAYDNSASYVDQLMESQF